jgi:hypothetical protein
MITIAVTTTGTRNRDASTDLHSFAPINGERSKKEKKKLFSVPYQFQAF